MKNNYKIERFKTEDLQEYKHIYISAFSSTPNLVIVKNKFFHQYQKLRPSFIAKTESCEGASFYGIITQRVTYNQQTFEIGQSCDSMTHKNHGGQGLFVRVAEIAYDFLKTNDVNYIYGFPNTTIYSLRKNKLYWEHTENINIFKQKIRTLPLDKIVKKLPILRSLYLSYAKTIFLKYQSSDAFFDNSVVVKDVAGVVHDLDYFNYKAGKNKFILKLNGIKFWLKIDGALWVGDFETTTLEKFKIAFDSLKRISSNAGISSILFHYQEGTRNNDLLSQLMETHSTMPVGYRNLKDEHKNKIFKFCGADFDTW